MTARSGTPLARLRAICLSLPEAREKLSHGEPTWFAGRGGKVFAMFDDHHHGAPHVSVWLPAPDGAQRVLIENDPQRFWRPPYLGHKGWIAVVLDARPQWKLVAMLVEQAYRLVAAPKLLAQLSSLPGAAPEANGRRRRASRGRLTQTPSSRARRRRES